MFDIVNWTHLVLACGKLVLQKTIGPIRLWRVIAHLLRRSVVKLFVVVFCQDEKELKNSKFQTIPGPEIQTYANGALLFQNKLSSKRYQSGLKLVWDRIQIKLQLIGSEKFQISLR